MSDCKYCKQFPKSPGHGHAVIHIEKIPFLPGGQEKAIETGQAAVKRSPRFMAWPVCNMGGSVSLGHSLQGENSHGT